MGQKDLTQKNLEYFPDVFADMINALLYGGEKVLSPENIKPAPTETIYFSRQGKLRNQFHDVSRYEMHGGKIWIQYVLENEVSPDKRLVLRKAGYEGTVYREQFDRKCQDIYPIISMVLYWGKSKRRIEKNLQDIFRKNQLPEKVLHYVANTELHLFSMRYLSKEIRGHFQSDMRIIVDYLAQGKDYRPTNQPIVHVKEFLLMMRELSGDYRYEQMALQLERERDQGVLDTEGGITMCELLDRYENRGMERGRQEGLQEGLQAGIKVLVETCQDFGLSKTETVSKVMQKFAVSKSESRHSTLKYWKV